MALDAKGLVDLYTKRASAYDLSANLYYLIGFREQAYRKMAVDRLRLRPGDRVIEIGCGTGLNLSLLQKAVGKEGEIIGVDLTEAMLQQARKRIERAGWQNVQLVKSDAAEYRFPPGVKGILSTFALTLVPEYERVIGNGAAALSVEGRWVVLDFKMPDPPWDRLAPLLIFLTSPFGVSRDLASRHPWEAMERHLPRTTVTEHYGGFVYIAEGEK